MAAKNSIQVAIKVRPLLRKEKNLTSLWRVVGNSIQLLESQSDPFSFDYIFDQDTDNAIIFDKMAKHIVHSALQGFNGTIFAYGQTASGKTYTMMGDDDNPGVTVLAVKEIFREIQNASDRQFLLRVGYIEIYNEKIYDLLNKKNQDLKIHESTGTISINCEEVIITCEEQLLQLLCGGNKERTVGGTNMNERSSRSHAIFRIIIESRKIDRTEDDAVTQSVLNLVDLAGSERADQTGATGARLKEGGHINKSLLFLSNVIKRLAENEHEYISYRDSKLTRILQASLGGNALTSIICTIQPTVVEETQSTLNFALRAKSVKNKPQVNEIVSDATMMKRLEREINDLRNRLAEEKRKNESQIKVGQLEQRLRGEVLKIISCNSLNNLQMQRDRRRRTWCAASEATMATALPLPTKFIETGDAGTEISSFLQMPKARMFCTPQIGVRPTIMDVVTETVRTRPAPIAEETQPPQVDRENTNSPESSGDGPLSTSVSPITILTPRSCLQIVERSYRELQEYTNLESKCGVQHDTYGALKEKLALLTERNELLERDRLECIQVHAELTQARRCSNDCEERCSELQLKVQNLQELNEIAHTNIADYEKELQQLKESAHQLQVENQEAVSLEFEFQRLKNKSKQRESELLELLQEKDNEIAKLGKSLKGLIEEKLQSRHDFERLTLELQQLKAKYAEATSEVTHSNARVLELEETEQQLHAEINALREQLQRVQLEFSQLNYAEKCEKSASDENLNRIVATAQRDMLELQTKYDILSAKWTQQECTIHEIQTAYDVIRLKYQDLQAEHEVLESNSTQSLDDCERLQRENAKLQQEIAELRTRVEEAQQNLSEGMTADLLDYAAIQKENADLSTQLMDSLHDNEVLQAQNNKLTEELKLLRQQHANVKSDAAVTITPQAACCKQVKKEADDVYSESTKHTDTNYASNDVSSSDFSVSSSVTMSMKSSGVGMDDEQLLATSGEQEKGAKLLAKFVALAERLQEIELEVSAGKSCLFRARECMNRSAHPCKLYLRNLTEVMTWQPQQLLEEETGEKLADEDIMACCMKGILKAHHFRIVELKLPTQHNGNIKLKCEDERDVDTDQLQEQDRREPQLMAETIAELRRQVDELTQRNECLCNEKRALLQTTERTIAEFREQITTLTAELLEKSQIVENCACNEYQKQIDCLKYECAELHEKSRYSDVSDDSDESSVHKTANMTLIEEGKKALDNEEAKLNATIAELRSELALKLELVARLEAELKDIQQANEQLKAEFKLKEETLRTECNNLKLELCEKMEVSESEYRKNLQKYNREWEESKEIYESKIVELQAQLDRAAKNSENIDTVREQENVLCSLREELNGMQVQNMEMGALLDAANEASEMMRSRIVLLENERLSAEEERKDCTKCKELKQSELELGEVLLKLKSSQVKLVEEKGELQDMHKLTERRIKELETEITELTDAHAALKDENRQYIKNLSQLREENVRTAEDLNKRQNAFEDLSAELKMAKEKHNELLHEKAELARCKDGLQQELESLRTECTFAKKLKHILAMHNAANKSEVEDALATATENNACWEDQQLAAFQQQLQDLDALRKDWENLQKTLESLQTEKLELEQRSASITAAKNDNDDKLAQLSEENARCEEQIKSLRLQLSDFELLQQQSDKLKQSMETAKVQYTNTLHALQQERDTLQQTLEKQTEQTQAVEAMKDTLNLKADSLSQQLHEAKSKLQVYENLASDNAELEAALTQANKEKSQLAEQVRQLQEIVSKAQASDNEKLQQHKTEVHALQEQLTMKHAEYATVLQQQEALRLELQSRPDAEALHALQRRCKDAESAAVELRLKCDALKEANTLLQQTNASLKQQAQNVTQKTEECNAMREELETVRMQHRQLQLRMEASAAEAVSCKRVLQQDVQHHKALLEQHAETYSNLRRVMDTKESAFKQEKQKLEGTISCLLTEKKSLEEKLYATELTLKKFESELGTLQKRTSDSANSSVDSCSPRSHKSGAENTLKPMNIEDKVTGLQAKKMAQMDALERKNRRLSIHDERRQQALWLTTRDVASMTDPMDGSCKCEELDRKLQECERNLYIRESQVTALNMNLKFHPLKEEKAALIKRVQEEQEKYRVDVKRYKQIISDQQLKIADAVLAAKVHEAQRLSKQLKQNGTQTDNELVATRAKQLKPSETQTEFELDATLHKLQGKYNDLKNLCRDRARVIRELQQRIAQYEQPTTTDRVPLTTTEMELKQRYEMLEKDLTIVKRKYENAKIVLAHRRDEIERMQGELKARNNANDCGTKNDMEEIS